MNFSTFSALAGIMALLCVTRFTFALKLSNSSSYWSVTGNGQITAIKWNITAIDDDKFRVKFEATKDFPSSTYIALGLSRSPSMQFCLNSNQPHSFIILCAKTKNDQLVAQSRYAVEHVLPEKNDWGLSLTTPTNVSTSSANNGCTVTIPAILLNSDDEEEKRPVTLNSGDDPLYILLASGELDEAGNPQYHGSSKEVLHESGRQYVESMLGAHAHHHHHEHNHTHAHDE